MFFFQAEDGIRDYKVTGVQTCALPIWSRLKQPLTVARLIERTRDVLQIDHVSDTGGLDREITSPHVSSPGLALAGYTEDRKSTRLNSSHLVISYAVFCLKKKKT